MFNKVNYVQICNRHAVYTITAAISTPLENTVHYKIYVTYEDKKHTPPYSYSYKSACNSQQCRDVTIPPIRNTCTSQTADTTRAGAPHTMYMSQCQAKLACNSKQPTTEHCSL